MELARKYKDGLDFVSGIKRNYKAMVPAFVRAQIFKSPLVKAYYYEDKQNLLKFTEYFEFGQVRTGVNPAPFNLANAFIRASSGKSTNTRSYAERKAWFANTELAIYSFCNDEEWTSFDLNAESENLYPLPDFDNTNEEVVCDRFKDLINLRHSTEDIEQLERTLQMV